MSDQSRPQIVIYALADACAALAAAAEHGTAITLVSPAGAAAFAGPTWFRAVVTQAGAQVPSAKFDCALDCAGDAGLAMAAIREGVPAICFNGPDAARCKIEDIAAQSGCAIASIDYESALNLDQCAEPLATCRAWLAQKLAENEP
ncbi:MAG: hypothetical protein GKS02_13720 [Alphaproteobacteria bacterium]|nr:hypothetical protein [Alphaproteobacteria bacterium]